MYGMFVTRYEMACLEGTRFVNFMVRISHSLCFFYKASQLCLLYIIFSIITNGYIHMQVIQMYCRLLNAQQGPSRVNHYFDPSFAVDYQYYFNNNICSTWFLTWSNSFHEIAL